MQVCMAFYHCFFFRQLIWWNECALLSICDFSNRPPKEWGISGRPITDLVSDSNLRFILEKRLRVKREVFDLEIWEINFVRDVESIFG